MPDNAYGNCPPVEIERDLQQGGDPNWDQKPTNEEDLGDLYSTKFFNHILASTAPTFTSSSRRNNSWIVGNLGILVKRQNILACGSLEIVQNTL